MADKRPKRQTVQADVSVEAGDLTLHSEALPPMSMDALRGFDRLANGLSRVTRDRLDPGGSKPLVKFNVKFKLGDSMKRIITVDGKTVEFKERFPVNESKALSKAMVAAMDGDPDRIIALLCQVIVKWGFDGDPDDPAAYKTDEMDWIRHVWPMYLNFNTYAAELGNLDTLKN